MDGSRIRPARAEDVEQIAGLHARAWREAYEGLLPADHLRPWPGEDAAARWRSLLAGAVPGLDTRVAVTDGALAGFCATLVPARDGDLAPGTGEIAAIYVEPGLWGRGVGRALSNDALERLAGRSTRVSVWAFAGNRRALAFYRHLGFERDGATQRHSSGRDEIRLILPLNGMDLRPEE